MFINSLILAISSSIDSLGIGMTYGLKNTKLSLKSKVILFIISITVTIFSVLLGSSLRNFLPTFVAKFIGSSILIILGIIIIIQGIKNKEDFDFNKSNTIEPSEAFALGIALSLDSLCIGIGGSIFGLNISIFPIFVAILQLLFIDFGIFMGKKIIHLTKIPNSIWSILSGILLILIGTIKFKF